MSVSVLRTTCNPWGLDVAVCYMYISARVIAVSAATCRLLWPLWTKSPKRYMSEYISFTVLFVIITKWSVYAGGSGHTKVLCRYNAVDFLRNNHSTYHIIRLSRNDMGCLENYNTQCELKLGQCCMILYWIYIYIYTYIYIYQIPLSLSSIDMFSWLILGLHPTNESHCHWGKNIIHLNEVTLQILSSNIDRCPKRNNNKTQSWDAIYNRYTSTYLHGAD